MSGLQTKIVRGKVKLPKRLMVHGAPGVGKSTFASGAEDVLFIDPERRTGHLDVARTEPEVWLEVLETIKEVVDSKAAKVLVFSTLDFMQGMVHKYLCERGGVKTIEDLGGYGKGFAMATDEFRRLSNAMEACRRAGITCVLEAHSVIREFKNPTGENYDVWQIKLQQAIKSLIVERCDAVGFATYEDFARMKKGDFKAKAITTGERVLVFKHDPAFETKRGFDLPEIMPLKWSAWQDAVEKSYE